MCGIHFPSSTLAPTVSPSLFRDCRDLVLKAASLKLGRELELGRRRNKEAGYARLAPKLRYTKRTCSGKQVLQQSPPEVYRWHL